MRRVLLTTSFLSAFVWAAVPAQAQAMTKEAMEKIIHSYIMENPQVLIDSVNAYELKLQGEQDERAMSVVNENADWLYKNKNHGEAGNPKGDVTVVEFLDYNCGYCKQALGDLMTVLDEDNNVRVVFIDMPILGDSSQLAAKWSSAAQAQNKYLEFHVPLMRHRGAINESVLENYAKAANMDLDKAKAHVNDQKTEQHLLDNIGKARDFGLSGTPAFIVGKHIIRGYVGIDGLRQVIEDVRNNP